MRDGVIVLVKEQTKRNDRGVLVKKDKALREIFCQIESVTRSEFYEGGRNGLNPAFVFTVFAGDYCGEEVCIYEGRRYAIYRTYRTDDDYMELYAERKGGTNGEEDKDPGTCDSDREDPC